MNSNVMHCPTLSSSDIFRRVDSTNVSRLASVNPATQRAGAATPENTRTGDRSHPRPLTSTYLLSKHIQAVIFDLDGTLAPSKSRIADSTAHLLTRLLETVAVCIISGGTFEQFDTQVLPYLTASQNLTRLHLMPTCGTRYYRWVSG